jgi:hypothetical protein
MLKFAPQNKFLQNFFLWSKMKHLLEYSVYQNWKIEKLNNYSAEAQGDFNHSIADAPKVDTCKYERLCYCVKWKVGGFGVKLAHFWL